MFTNPIGLFNSKPEGGEGEKKKRRNKKKKNLSPEASEESAHSLQGSKTDLNSATPEEPQASSGFGFNLVDIVNEINTNVQTEPVVEVEEVVEVSQPVVEEVVEASQTVVEEVVEAVETKYEELPVEESTMKTILEQLSTNSENNAVEESPAVEDCWESMLEQPNQESAWESEVDASPQAMDSVWEQMLTGPAKETTPSAKEASPPAKDATPPAKEATPPAVKEATPTIQEEESGWESLLADPSEMETDPERTKYVEEFNISENTYNLVKDFYEDQKASRVYGLLETDLLRYLFVNALDRKELEGITEEDVDRALKVVDGDNDNKVTFDEFIQLLSLFFSSKNNIKQRINGVLNNKYHEKDGSLTSKDADSVTEFLNNFYGKPEGEEVEAEQKESSNFLTKLVKKILNRKEKKSDVENDTNNDDLSIDFDTYSTEAAEELQNFCFVKFTQTEI